LGVGVSLAAPILLAALGGLLCIRAGILNIGLEGIMLIGAFAAAAVSSATQSAWLGLCAAMVSGLIGGWIFAFLSVDRGASQVVVGLGLNILAVGLTGYALQVYPPAGDGSLVASFQPVIASGRRAPVIGALVFSQSAPVLMAFLAVPVAWFAINRTNWGLAVRACGDDPASVDALGHDVLRLQRQAVVWGNLLAASGGAILSLSYIGVFTDGMTGGRGYLALAAFIFGRWTAFGTAAASLVFATADALQYQLQTLQAKVPYQLMIALPYLLALLAMMFSAGGGHAPRAVGVPFVPDRHSVWKWRIGRKRGSEVPAMKS